MQLELWEKGTFRDTLVADFYLAVPGLGGSPHVDPQAKPYSWTSPKPVPHNRLMQAVASLQPLGLLPAVQAAGVSSQQQRQLLVAAGSSSGAAATQSGARTAAALDAGDGTVAGADGAGGSSDSQGASQGSSSSVVSAAAGNNSSSFAAMYPSGRLMVRCGWVADGGIEPHFTPFQHTDGPFAFGHAKETSLQHSLRLPNSSSFGEDGLVQVHATSRPLGPGAGSGGRQQGGSAPSSPAKQQTGELGTSTYGNPLAYHGAGTGLTTATAGSPAGSPRKAGSRFGSAAGGSAGADVMYGNPLAHLGEDVEVGQTLAPPMPPLKADRALQRVAQGVGHKVGVSSWSPQHSSAYINCTLLTCIQQPEAPLTAQCLCLFPGDSAA